MSLFAKHALSKMLEGHFSPGFFTEGRRRLANKLEQCVPYYVPQKCFPYQSHKNVSHINPHINPNIPIKINQHIFILAGNRIKMIIIMKIPYTINFHNFRMSFPTRIVRRRPPQTSKKT